MSTVNYNVVTVVNVHYAVYHKELGGPCDTELSCHCNYLLCAPMVYTIDRFIIHCILYRKML